MFGKKKSQALLNAVDDSRTVVHDFRLRSSSPTGFESYRTVPYRQFHKLEEEEMLPRIEEHLAKLFAGEVDSANGDMIDAVIIGAYREALSDLYRQHYNHMDTLHRLIIRHDTDREDIRRHIEDREAELEAIRADLEKTCRMLGKSEEV